MKFGHEVCQIFADRLRELRIEKQLTQKQLDKKLGVSCGSISFYENCDRVPGIVFLVATANYFGVDVRYLLGLTDVRTIDANLQQTKKPTVPDRELEYRAELFRLMQAHPDLPIVPMVDSGIVADDYCQWWVGNWGYARITEYIMGDERIFFKDDDEDAVLDGIEEYRSVWEDWPDEKITETFNNLPWIKCIAVHITT